MKARLKYNDDLTIIRACLGTQDMREAAYQDILKLNQLDAACLILEAQKQGAPALQAVLNVMKFGS